MPKIPPKFKKVASGLSKGAGFLGTAGMLLSILRRANGLDI